MNFVRLFFWIMVGICGHYSINHPIESFSIVNPVLQPANLAVRNAWFSGGVEWNVSVPGHCPLTCSPVFAARTGTETGERVLRLYESGAWYHLPVECLFENGDAVIIRLHQH